MSTKRDKIMEFIQQYRATHGQNSPSLQEIAQHMRLSKSTIRVHLLSLAAEGRIERRDNKLVVLDPDYR